MSNYDRNYPNISNGTDDNENTPKKKKSLFDRFMYSDGKGVSDDEIQISEHPTLLNFFKLLWRKLNPMLSINILFVLGNFPIFFFFLAMSGYFSIHTTTPYYTIYAPLHGAMLFDDSAAHSALWTMFSRQAEVTVQTTVDYVLLALSALLIITFGLVRVGCTYLTRNMFRGEPIFMMHDFFYCIKRNLRQAIIYGILDVGIIALLVYDIVFFSLNYSSGFMMMTMFFMSLCLALMYFFMRQYIYLMLITFDLSIFKMFKNALLFTVLGIKRNIMFLLGTFAVLFLEYVLMVIFIPLGVIVPFVILPSLLIMMGVYAVYPKIKEIMIDPYYEKITASQTEDAEENEE